ncbi:hypothetical protein Vadar_002194 [Vaccinium darrowii]|uniref:Uncharacterized protein n=1 Tax=Vaccinium darrowii TaxID=229202 RepID=A0ACB7Z0T3_9ERIC|nr:hypothetical protein Vadar_002194 [Vaccinium darrowii]
MCKLYIGEFDVSGYASDSLATARDMGKIPDIPAAVAAVKNPGSKIVYGDRHRELYPPGDPSKRAFSSLRDPRDDSSRVNTMNILRPLSPHLPIFSAEFFFVALFKHSFCSF